MDDTADRAAAFEKQFGGNATHVARAPGRVNLIGEHIDYLGLPVLPMALDRGVTVTFRPRADGMIHVANRDARFEPVEFPLAEEPPRSAEGHWGNYLKAAASVAAGRYGAARGIDALVDSTLPVASGLSSSSALMVATTLALLSANDADIDGVEVAQAVAEGERYTGTQGGGMDQAISLCARKNHAARIDFDPLRLQHVPVPRDWTFIIADSGRAAEKSGAAKEAYNERAVQCRRALAEVVSHLELAHGDGSAVEYADLFASTRPAGREALGNRAAELDPDELVDTGDLILPPLLAARFRHVISETQRVESAQHAMQFEDRMSFGFLMSLSHRSLAEDYQVSTPELDEIVSIAVRNGAAGARLTGAGFGGSAVILCSETQTRPLIHELQSRFYEGRRGGGDGRTALFTSRPSEGAGVRPL